MTNIKIRNDLINRLRVIKGHINGIEKMLEKDKECTAILMQIAAVKSSINKVGEAIIEEYTQECIIDALKEDKNIEESIKETIQTVLKFK